MAVEDLYRLFGHDNVRPIAQFGEGHFSPALQVYATYEQSAPLLVARIREVCGRYVVTRIEVFSPEFRTATGIGVGSRVSDVRRAYPEAQRNIEEHPSFIVSRLRLTFMVSAISLADSLPVTKIWTWGTIPDTVRSRCRQGLRRAA